MLVLVYFWVKNYNYMLIWQYLLIFIGTSIFSYLLTHLVIRFAFRFKIVDYPDRERKIHKKVTPLMGGVAIFMIFFIAIFVFLPQLLVGDLSINHWLGFAIGSLVLMIGGVLDDRYNLPAHVQIIFPIIASVLPILGGVRIEHLSGPGGDIFNISSFLSAILIIFWLLAMMYTTKLLDGVDGLVSGLGLIGALVIFVFTSTTQYFQADIALAALLLAAAILGFFILNFYPAKIFLGEGGSLFIGYALGVLAIISGGKIAIALLIMALPMMDVAWTILRRLYKGKNPFHFADRDHLHHRLLKIGLSSIQTVFVFYVFALLFGLAALFLQSQGKFLALLILLVIMLSLIIFFNLWEKRRRPKLLLHICCAPCAAYITKYSLLPRFEVVWYFYNPNLSSLEEYNRRLAAAERAAKIIGVKLIAAPYHHEAWRDMVRGRELDAERGKRCQLCYKERLEAAYRLAVDKKFDYFSTSLLSSPYKDSAAIIDICRDLSKKANPIFLEEDFQADRSFYKSLSWSRENGIYLQKYCGCEFSFR